MTIMMTVQLWRPVLRQRRLFSAVMKTGDCRPQMHLQAHNPWRQRMTVCGVTAASMLLALSDRHYQRPTFVSSYAIVHLSCPASNSRRLQE
jgi:hypothetical protein